MNVRRLLVPFLVIALGCSSEVIEPRIDAPFVVSSKSDDTAHFANARAVIRLAATDMWGQPLSSGATSISLVYGNYVVTRHPNEFGELPLIGEGTFDIVVNSDGFEPVTLRVAVSGAALTPRITGTSSPQNAAAIGRRTFQLGGVSLPEYVVHIGVPHKFFSTQGRPARRGNDLTLLMDGEEAWGVVATELFTAFDNVNISTWRWDSEFELLRDPNNHATQSEQERSANTIMGLLESIPATKRALVNQFVEQDNILTGVLNTDSALRRHGADRADNFEFMQIANASRGQFHVAAQTEDFSARVVQGDPSALGEDLTTIQQPLSVFAPRNVDMTQVPLQADIPHASWHQKFLTVDNAIAFVGGMNLSANDWDTSEHLVYDPRRMKFDASAAARSQVYFHQKETDLKPRKDYMVRIDGPLVGDVEDVFSVRWNAARSQGIRFAENTTAFDPRANVAPVDDGVYAQLTATMPSPFGEYAIAETWIKAVRQAEYYIFIEDQYFRIPLLVDEIIARMREVPALKVVVVTAAVTRNDPACRWSGKTAEQLEALFPDRFSLFQLKSFDRSSVSNNYSLGHFVGIDIHSKMLIVDDIFMSVGSANKNNRGVLYEGELNLAIYDRAWVTAARERIVTNILGVASVPADSGQWVSAMQESAQANDSVEATWRSRDMRASVSIDEDLSPSFIPSAFLYGLQFPHSSSCLFQSIGEDVF